MRILVIRLSSLGDVILTSSVLSELKERGIKADLLTFKPFGELFKDQPFINRVIEVKKEELKGLKEIRELAENLRDYDFAFDLHDVLRTKLLRHFLKCKVFTYKKRGLLRRLMTVFKPLKAKWLFVPHLYAEPFKEIGIKIENPRPYLKVDGKSLKRVEELLPKGRELVALAPGARWPNKEYPLERFKRISELLIKEGFKVVAVGGEKEREKGKILEETGAINLCGELSLKESLALISKCSLVISNDSGVVHMARAVKTKVLALFGPTHPAFGFAPFKEEGKALTLNLPCSPCSLHGKKVRCRERVCFKIPPEEVVKEGMKLLEK